MHAGGDALNQALGNVGKTVGLHRDREPDAVDQVADMKSLVADMNAGKVQWLVILDVNPSTRAPADLNFADALQQGAEDGGIWASHVDETGADRALAYQQRALSGELVGCAGV